MDKITYINHRKQYWLSQGFDESISNLSAESDWRRYNTEKLQHNASTN